MKAHRKSGWVGLLLAVAWISAGCASKRPMVSAWQDPQFAPTKANTIAFTEQGGASPDVVALNQALKDELQREGFHLVSAAQADYLLAGILDQETKVEPVDQIRPFEPYSPISSVGTVGLHGYPAYVVTDAPINRLPKNNYKTTSPFIRLYLYTNPKTHNGRFQQVWQGSIDAKNFASVNNRQALLKALLMFLGKEHNGRVDLPKQG